jgi:hypothetical protein
MIEKIERVLTRVDRLNEIVGWLAGAVLLISMVLVPYEVIMRYFFNNPTSWSMELTQYLFCTMVALGGGWVLLTKGHVNVTIYPAFSPVLAEPGLSPAVHGLGRDIGQRLEPTHLPHKIHNPDWDFIDHIAECCGAH